jgi:hypothetical protein
VSLSPRRHERPPCRAPIRIHFSQTADRIFAGGERRAEARRLNLLQFAARILPERKDDAMDHAHYSTVFGLSLAAALGLMLALGALAQSAAPEFDGAREPAAPIRSSHQAAFRTDLPQSLRNACAEDRDFVCELP